ncbi:hypothetical protein LguiA_026712 [Lonicera macranthoides]
MIPIKFLSKIGVYEIQIHGVTLKVRLVHANDYSVVDIGISELRSQFVTKIEGPLHRGGVLRGGTLRGNLRGAERRSQVVTKFEGALPRGAERSSQFGTTVAGLVLQPAQNPKYFQLCVGTRCLMYQLPADGYSQIPESLNDFLSDSEICFVGIRELTNCRISCKSYIQVNKLAARVLKKPNLSRCSSGILETLASEVGINLEESSSGVNVDWKAEVFTDEEIKRATRDVCACYLIANKLLGSL